MNYYDHIESWLDGELEPEAAARFEQAAEQDPELAEEIARARMLRSHLAAIGKAQLDVPVPSSVLAALPAAKHSPRPPARRMKPAIRVARWAVLPILATALFLFLLRPSGPAETEMYSEAEIEAATQEALFALSIVADVTRDVTDRVRNDFLPSAAGPVFSGPSSSNTDE
jgi:anti-sigma factor RsiW